MIIIFIITNTMIILIQKTLLYKVSSDFKVYYDNNPTFIFCIYSIAFFPLNSSKAIIKYISVINEIITSKKE